jgi:hypothetical protein
MWRYGKMKKVFVMLLVAAAGASVDAAVSMSSSLTGYSGNTSQSGFRTVLTGAGLEAVAIPPWETGWEQIDFDSTGAKFGVYRAGWDGRNYLRTVETDYFTTSFTATVTVDRTARYGVWFGMGTGQRGSYYAPDVPDWGNAINGTVHVNLQSGWDNVSWGIDDGTSFSEKGYTGMNSITGLMQLKMNYDAVAKTVAFAIDYGADGIYEQNINAFDVSPAIAAMSGGDRGSIYFGGGDGLAFTNFSVVVPEPATMLLLGLGCLVLRKRR